MRIGSNNSGGPQGDFDFGMSDSDSKKRSRQQERERRQAEKRNEQALKNEQRQDEQRLAAQEQRERQREREARKRRRASGRGQKDLEDSLAREKQEAARAEQNKREQKQREQEQKERQKQREREQRQRERTYAQQAESYERQNQAPKEEKESWVRRGFRRMDESDAFELNDEAIDELAQSNDLLEHEKHQLHVKVGVLGGLLVVLLFFSLCISVDYDEVISPLEVLQCIGLFFQIQFNNLFTTQTPLNTTEVMAIQPNYYQVRTRFSITLLTAISGMLLSVSGMLYQNVFRNAIAAPTMLGVTSGVNLGVLILVILFGSAAINATGWRYLLCYACCIVILLLVLLGGKAVGGKGNFNVVNMMLVGTMVSQLVSTITRFITYLFMDDDLYEVYYEVQEQMNVDAGWESYLMLFIVVVVTMTPIIVTRFSMNSLSFSDEDSRLMGLNTNGLRILALSCGSIMVTAAMMYCGDVSMISLVVPHISRLVFGSEFRKQLVGNTLIGADLMIVCRDLSALIPFADTTLPISTVVSFVAMPFFVWMMAVQQRSFE